MGGSFAYLEAETSKSFAAVSDTQMPADAALSPCQACGACCNYSKDWPRFTTEDEAHLARLPRRLVNFHDTGMHCVGDRCSALAGDVGVATHCTVYADRPDVCRACEPGDDACSMARDRHGLPPLGPEPVATAN